MDNPSYTRIILTQIAQKLNRHPQELQPYIEILQLHKITTNQSLAGLRPLDYEYLQIPSRLARLIIQAVQINQKRIQYEPMEIESPFRDQISQIRQKNRPQVFAQIAEILYKIFKNIRNNFIQEKYRRLKKINPKICWLTGFPQVLNILFFAGFRETKQQYILYSPTISNLDDFLETLTEFQHKDPFNPFQEHISSIGNTDVKSYEGDSSVVYNQLLAQLQIQRQRMMSIPIIDRRIRIYQSSERNERKDWNEQQQKEYNNEDQRYYVEAMKKILYKHGDSLKFTNRRKQEYLELAKKPCFTETLIRVKLPDDWIFECVFAPMEPLQSLLRIFHENIQNKQMNYYLYMTPPVQKLQGLILRSSFYDLGCVPRAIFYFKSDE